MHNTNKHFHFIVPVWGETFTQLFTTICLPLLMTVGALRNLPTNESDQFVIVTTWHDCTMIRASIAYQQLQKLMKIKFILIDGLIHLENSYVAMSHCYSLAMREQDV